MWKNHMVPFFEANKLKHLKHYTQPGPSIRGGFCFTIWCHCAIIPITEAIKLNSGVWQLNMWTDLPSSLVFFQPKKATAMTAMLACFPFVRLFLGHVKVYPWKLTFWTPKVMKLLVQISFSHREFSGEPAVTNRQHPKRELAFQNSPEN